MNNKLPILSLALAVLTASPLPASPVRSSLGGDGLSRIDDEAVNNLWVWPLTSIRSGATRTPRSIWTPQLDTWYEDISPDGYVFYSGSSKMVDFSEASITTSFRSGYSCGTFLPLEPGHYVLGCVVDGLTQFRLGFYKEAEGGYRWASWTTLASQSGAGYYERVFTVPAECSLVLVIPTSGSVSAPPLTVTDIEIYRLD